MTRYAIISDIHGQIDRLEAVLLDARRRSATAYISLGDVGTDLCYDRLRHIRAQAVFGNYEVSGWGKLSVENQGWVRALPPLLVGQSFLAAHAAPTFPVLLQDVMDTMDYLRKHGIRWDTLFPRMDKDEKVRWLTCAALIERNKRIFFHGHTHRGQIWYLGPRGTMTLLRQASTSIDWRGRYIIGVGSVGQPEMGTDPCYALYDSDIGEIELCQVVLDLTPA